MIWAVVSPVTVGQNRNDQKKIPWAWTPRGRIRCGQLTVGLNAERLTHKAAIRSVPTRSGGIRWVLAVAGGGGSGRQFPK